MNDRRLNELLRMAGEVDDLERSADGMSSSRRPGLNATANGAKSPALIRTDRLIRRQMFGALSMAAALAIAGVGFWLNSQSNRSSAPPVATSDSERGVSEVPARDYVKHVPLSTPTLVDAPTGTVVRSTPPVPVVGSLDESVVLAIYRNDAGDLHCVQLAPHTWSNRCLPDVQPVELRSVSFGTPCATQPRHTLLIALAGPRRSLPTSEASAVSLAKCILSMPRVCDGDAACFSGPASQCVPAGVSVKIESVADRSWNADLQR